MSAETKEQTPPENISVIRIILKALSLFVLLNTLYIWVRPTMTASLYNTTLIPGRQRLPYSGTPETAYSLSLFNLDAMFASHEISADKPEDEYRVLVLGDSSIWGFLLTNDQTLVSNLNQSNLNTDDHKNVRFYNLGYPTISLTKDLMLLNHAMQYQPDMIIWVFTLEAFPPNKQFSPPIVQNNSQHPVHPNNFDFTLIAERRNIADVFRLQLYAPLWAATGIDQTIPEIYTPHAINLKPDPTFHGSETISLEELALSKILAGHKITTEAGIPLILVNEPIFVSDGKNSDIRYRKSVV